MLSNVHLPSSAAEAVDLLRDGGWVVGGGTVVMPRVNTGAVPVGQLISLRRAGLSDIRVDGVDTGGTVSVGVATTLGALGADGRLAFLHPVVRSIASPPVRNLATVGGNLLVAQPYGDLAVALLALDARVDVVSGDGVREVPVGELAAGPAEVVSAVHFALPRAGTWFYRKAMRRRHNSASIVTVAAVVAVEDGVVRHARIALGGVGPRPMRALAAERALLGAPFGRSTVEAAAEDAREGIEPFDDAYASAWYRTRVLPVHVRRALLGEE
ncbi:MAG: xanthine dehydrogenase family protein subunit M [Actinophytocola sp.]|uniref:FAD binding domain-containing protein n=1 Tax=Actinophytocola sp. TaxID=1872138 RepID=UPI00132A4201|nr:FAD binding domain-containing protein [Actinophytocola sp.]MPZ80373.1 xanthine dehydrogenase family protein subunit M [Actinophytocola sp.]